MANQNNGYIMQAMGDVITSSTCQAMDVPEGDRATSIQTNEQNNFSVQRPTIERPLSDLHINIVASQVSRRLLEGMMVNAGLNHMEENEVKHIKDRMKACTELLKIWKRKDNNAKQVQDLIDLVRSVDGNNEQIARHLESFT